MISLILCVLLAGVAGYISVKDELSYVVVFERDEWMFYVNKKLTYALLFSVIMIICCAN